MFAQYPNVSNTTQWSNDDYDVVSFDHNCPEVDQKNDKNDQDQHNNSYQAGADLDNTVEREHEHDYELDVGQQADDDSVQEDELVDELQVHNTVVVEIDCSKYHQQNDKVNQKHPSITMMSQYEIDGKQSVGEG